MRKILTRWLAILFLKSLDVEWEDNFYDLIVKEHALPVDRCVQVSVKFSKG